MTPRADPYRVLGLVVGATPGEIRSAYRRLAKLNHPDTAGDRSLPRFLAIQAAYEDLLDDDGKLRVRGWPSRRGGSARPASPSAKGASRDAWRARQAAGTPGSQQDGGGKPGAGRRAGGPARGAASDAGTQPGGPGPRARPDGSRRAETGTGQEAPGAGRAPGGARRGDGPARAGRGRPRSAERRTARPGSTTYDEAAQPLDPSWDGAAWYGASSGRYWTLNPREYADPRKHGPEYQERARRASRQEAARRARGARDGGDGEPGADESPGREDGQAGASPPAPPHVASPGASGRS